LATGATAIVAAAMATEASAERMEEIVGILISKVSASFRAWAETDRLSGQDIHSGQAALHAANPKAQSVRAFLLFPSV
jgi:hypothetical protein